jgi:hypothetical protein
MFERLAAMRTALLALCAFFLCNSVAPAGPILSMFIDPGSGRLRSGGGTLHGSRFAVDSILSQHTPLHDNGSLPLFKSVGPHGGLDGDAHFRFTTGQLLSEHTFGHVEVFQYAAGGSFSLIGGANLDHGSKFHTGDIQAGSILLSGQFNSKVTVVYDQQTGLATLTGSTRDTLNPALASYYGLTGPYRGFVDLAFRFNPDGDDRGRRIPDRDDIHSFGGFITVFHAAPEPGVLTLMLSGGLFGAGMCWRGWKRRLAAG